MKASEFLKSLKGETKSVRVGGAEIELRSPTAGEVYVVRELFSEGLGDKTKFFTQGYKASVAAVAACAEVSDDDAMRLIRAAGGDSSEIVSESLALCGFAPVGKEDEVGSEAPFSSPD